MDKFKLKQTWHTIIGLLPAMGAYRSYEQSHEILSGLIAGLILYGVLFGITKLVERISGKSTNAMDISDENIKNNDSSDPSKSSLQLKHGYVVLAIAILVSVAIICLLFRYDVRIGENNHQMRYDRWTSKVEHYIPCPNANIWVWVQVEDFPNLAFKKECN